MSRVEKLLEEHKKLFDKILDETKLDEKSIGNAIKNLIGNDFSPEAMKEMASNLFQDPRKIDNRSKYVNFQLLPELAKLSFEEYCEYCDGVQKLGMEFMTEHNNKISNSISPELWQSFGSDLFDQDMFNPPED